MKEDIDLYDKMILFCKIFCNNDYVSYDSITMFEHAILNS